MVPLFLSLANKQHVVYTGVCLKTPKTELQFYESAKVKFGDVSERQIKEYIETGDPMWVQLEHIAISHGNVALELLQVFVLK